MDNLINGIGYLELQNLTEVNVNNIITSNIICDTIQADDANIGILNCGTGIFNDLIVNKNFNASTGIFNSISYLSSTGNTGYVNSLAYQSSTGNYSNIKFIDMQRLTGPTGFIGGFEANTIRFSSSLTGPTGFIQNIITQNLTGNTGYFRNLGFISSTGTNISCSSGSINILNSNSVRVNSSMQNFTGPTGFYGTSLITDSRVVNNFDLCRNILRFHTPVYQTPNDGISNPQTLINANVNGIRDSDGNWAGTYYVPNNDGTIPHGQPFFIKKQSGFGSVLDTARTNLNNNLTLLGGYSNMLYVFIYNSITQLYEYQGYINVSTPDVLPTANQFNSRANSFTLPTTRGSNNNILTSNGAGGSTWNSSVNVSSITVSQGTASTPSISIIGDLNTGLFSSGADNLDITTNGVSRLNVSNSGVFTQDIRVNSGVGGQLVFFQPTTKYLSSYNQLDLPVSTATQSALNQKANILNPIFTGVITCSSITGSNASFQSYTGASGFFRDLESQNLSSIVVDSNNGNITNLNSTTANINQIFSGSGYFDNYLQADTRVVNNYELLRNISRFYEEIYYNGVSSPAYTDPLVFTNSFQNGLRIEDSSYQSIVYMPARNGIIIPNGQPVYYYMNATLASSISSIGTNMTSNLTLPGGNVNRTYIFIFNINTALFEYQGYLTNYTPGTANQFNSRNNSYILPTNRPAQYNVLSALTNGFTEWTDNILLNNIASTSANIAFLTNTTMTGTNGFFENLNTSDNRIHLGSLSGETAQSINGVALGSEAGRTSQGNSAVSIGYRCGNNNQAQGSIAIGSESGQTSQRTNAVAIGRLSGRTSQRDNAISIGNLAGNNDQRENSVAIGFQAGQTSQNTNSIAIGQNAGQTSQASNSIAIGQNSGQSSQQIQSIAIGFQAGQTSQRSNSIAIGIDSGQTNQLGSNIAIGFQAGQNSQGIGCISIGDRAGQTSQQTQSLSIGTLSGATRQGTGSIAIGYLAAQSNQSINCVALGFEAGWNGQNRNSIAIGYRAGYNNQSINSIVINGTGNILNTDGADRCFIAPLRNTNRTESMRDMFYNVSTNELTFSTFQDLIGGPIAVGGVFTTIFTMATNGNYLLSLNTRANDGNYALCICYQEEGANGLVVALNQNNLQFQTVAVNTVQIRTVNATTYNFYYSARRLL